MLVSSDDQVKAYIRKIMSALDRWMKDGKISKLVIVITEKDTGEHVERWQFDVSAFPQAMPFRPLGCSGCRNRCHLRKLADLILVTSQRSIFLRHPNPPNQKRAVKAAPNC